MPALKHVKLNLLAPIGPITQWTDTVTCFQPAQVLMKPAQIVFQEEIIA